MGDETIWAGDELMRLADLITPMSVRFAAAVGLADHLAAGGRTVAELATRLTNDPALREALPPGTTAVAVDHQLLAAVLDRLVFADLLRVDATGRYTLTSQGELLRDDHPARIRAWINPLWPIARGDLSLIHLLPAVLTGQPTFTLANGRTFWEDLAANATRADRFGQLMGWAQQAAEAHAAVDAYDWSTCGSVLDVGGGDASLLIALLQAHPTLRGGVLELAGPTADAAGSALRRADLADRGSVLTGDFFDDLPTGYGGYILSAILHDWSDRHAVRILTRCATAAGAGGRVFIIEGWGHSHGPDMQTTMAVRLAALFGGRERTTDQLTALAAGAGLTVRSVIPTSHRTIIELVPVRGARPSPTLT